MLLPVCVDGASNEWSIVELQGNLVVDDNGAMTDVDIGTLRYVDGVPTIRIGNHILTGKVAALPKPFAILQKDVREGAVRSVGANDGGKDNASDDNADAAAKDAQMQYEVVGIARTRVIFNSRPKPVLVE
uniref:Chromosome transmission fidelity protein 8 n=1 Tax=Globisporangium ultimum (strain ATCC 200006 / CBS 805.95 / DAOM BR144) TaxID=431595 RepID=K3X789_GLOUD